MFVRVATPDDAPAIATIYNQGIEDRIGTFETRLRTPQEIESWFDGVHPIVALEQDQDVVQPLSTETVPATRVLLNAQSMSDVIGVGMAWVDSPLRHFCSGESRQVSGN